MHQTHSNNIDQFESFQEKKRQNKLSLRPNLLLNSVSCPIKTKRIFSSYFKKSCPLHDKTEVSVPFLHDFTNTLSTPMVIKFYFSNVEIYKK
jgi:hypothetical protein